MEVSATLEVLVPPRVEALYFWALQVDLADGRGIWGGGHTGLQWNRRYPGGKAVNWGGYASPEQGGRVLSGSASSLPGFPDDPNTLAFSWQVARPYRFRVYSSDESRRGLAGGSGRSRVRRCSRHRDLLPSPGRGSGPVYLARPLVWSEVFAGCDAPSVTVRWSGLRAVDASGAVLSPETVQVNYQAAAEGGCANTTVATDALGVLQITGAERSVPQGGVLILPDAAR